MTEERILSILKKSKERKRQLRSLNRAHLSLQHQYNSMNTGNIQQIKYLNSQLTQERERSKKVDYCSVCQCLICRFREWYSFRNGETYPSNLGWRFPWRTK